MPYTRDVIWYFSFSVWLTSLCMTVSRSIHISTGDPILFLWLSDILLCVCVCVCHIFFMHSSDGHLACFHVLAIVNGAAVNTGLQVSFWVMFFSGYMPSNGIAGSDGSSVFSFLKEPPYCSPQWLYRCIFPTAARLTVLFTDWKSVMSCFLILVICVFSCFNLCQSY